MQDMSTGKCPFGFGAETAETDAPTRPAAEAAPSAGKHVIARGLARDKLPELRREEIAPGDGGLPTGRCLCGKVSFQIKRPVEAVFAHHDAQSRKRAGGVALTLMTRASNMAVTGWGRLVHYPMSEREVSAFCRICGTPVLSYYLAPEAMDGMAQVSVGALDSTDGLRLAADISVDEKPGFYAFNGTRREVTSDALEAMFASGSCTAPGTTP